MRVVAFDCETYRFAAARRVPTVIVSAWTDDGAHAQLCDSAETVTRLAATLADKSTVLVNVNIAYDLLSTYVTALEDTRFSRSFVWALWREIWHAYAAGRIISIDRADMLLRIANDTFDKCPILGREPAKPSSAAQLNTVWLGLPLVDKKSGEHIRTRFDEVSHLPPSQYPREFADYVAGDALSAWQVWARMAHHSLPDLARQSAIAFVAQLTQAHGLRTDPQAVDALDHKLTASVEAMRTALVANGLGFYKPNGDFTKPRKPLHDRIAQAYTAKGDTAPRSAPTKTFPDGQVKSDRDTLFESGDPVLIRLALVGQDETEFTTFLPWLRLGAVEPVHPGFWNPVSSGRISCRSPNITNQPRREGVRSCYVARPGRVFVTCDVPSAELGALAQIWLERYGYSRLADAINAGYDPHLLLAADLLGLTYETARELYKAGDATVSETRQLAKIGNFGLPGGLSPKRFYYHVLENTRRDDGTFPEWVQAFTMADSERVCRAWGRLWPESQLYFAQAKRETRGRSASLTTPYTGRTRGGLRFTTWCNTQFQGRIADVATSAWVDAMRQAYTDTESGLWGSRSIALIHDEILIEAPAERVHEAGNALADCLNRSLAFYIPDIRIICKPSAMLRWYKGAEPVHVNGRLVPSRPVKTGKKTQWVHDTTGVLYD